MATLQFLGATGCVTGSKYLLTARNGEHLLIDCGLFQGAHELRDRNWEPLPIADTEIHNIVLTHAHLDHTGYFPRLAKDGFEGKVFASETTVDLCGIMWPDSGRIQEEDAQFANKTQYTKHKPALPLYTEEEARTALRFLRGVKYRTPTRLSDNFSFTLYPAGHILGSCWVAVDIRGEATPTRLLFSGDLGRYDQPITVDPTPIESADLLVVESTYGDRLHDGTDPKQKLAEVIDSTCRHGGTVIVPSFAVGRTQELMYLLRELEDSGRLPHIPIFIDSPMAVSVTNVLLAHPEEHDLEMTELEQRGIDPLGTHEVTFVRSVEESKALNSNALPKVIIASSGMCTGGRVLHHLRHRLSDPLTTVLFVGYQAEGTLGRYLKDGAKETKIHGQRLVVRARIESIEHFSAHADYNEELRWMSSLKKPPHAVFITHGEEPARKSLSEKITAQLAWKTVLPQYLQTFDLSGF